MPRRTGRHVSAAERAARLDTRIVAGFGVGYGIAAMVAGTAVAVAAGIYVPFSTDMIAFMLLAGLHGIPAGVLAGLCVRVIRALRTRILAGPVPMAGFGAAVATATAPFFPLPFGLPLMIVAAVQGTAPLWGVPGWRFVASAVPVGAVAGVATWVFLRRWLRERDVAASAGPSVEHST